MLADYDEIITSSINIKEMKLPGSVQSHKGKITVLLLASTPCIDTGLPYEKQHGAVRLKAVRSDRLSCAVVANFYAPWCPWCQRLEPTYETVTQKVHEKYPESDGRIRFIKVSCFSIFSIYVLITKSVLLS